MKIGKTKAKAPYTANGKANFPKQNVPGAYLIYKAGKLRYVGMSQSNVYKTMYRHFQSWEDSRQVRVTYKNLKEISCRVIYCSPTNAAKIERALIVKYRPKDNPDKLQNYILTPGEETIVKTINESPFSDVPF